MRVRLQETLNTYRLVDSFIGVSQCLELGALSAFLKPFDQISRAREALVLSLPAAGVAGGVGEGSAGISLLFYQVRVATFVTVFTACGY